MERTLGGGARVSASRRLTGGIGSAVHRLTVAGDFGGRRFVVLRQYEADDEGAVEREALALDGLATAGAAVPAPRLLGFDATGDDAGGHRSLLMSREPGRVHLTPRDERAWAQQMAEVLARIHELDIAAPPYRAWDLVATRPPPTSARDRRLWRDVQRVLSEPAPAVEPTFIHRDFQHFNMLWSRERLTSIVDWTWASTGPRDVDVAHCRLNLAVLFSPSLADHFLDAYQSLTGYVVNPWWDLNGLAHFSDSWLEFIPVQVARRREVDLAGMPARIEALMRSALTRL